jgi:hypothetical protein
MPTDCGGSTATGTGAAKPPGNPRKMGKGPIVFYQSSPEAVERIWTRTCGTPSKTATRKSCGDTMRKLALGDAVSFKRNSLGLTDL